MPRRRSKLPTHARPFVTWLVAIVAVATAAGGCEAVFGPEPLPSTRIVSTPEPPAEPTPSEIDEFQTLPPEPGDNEATLVAAAEALADLDSYRVTVTTRGLVPATTPGGTVSMTSTLVQGDDPAASFTATGLAGVGRGRLQAVVIGDEAWLKEGGGSWQKSPGGAADFDAAFTALSPSDLAEGFEAVSPSLSVVGTEQRNGQRAVHSRATSSDPRAAEAGLASGSIDLWRATRGGHLVALVVDGTWPAEDTAEPTPVFLRIEVSHVDDPTNGVRAPK